MSQTPIPPANCPSCPRLVKYRGEIARQYPHFHNAPVPAWGDRRARALIVGLAPGLQGAGRTGKAFVGDASGQFLFKALARTGFASTDDARQARLQGLRISNAVKCLPPGNAVNAAELHQCSRYLQAELDLLHPPASRRHRVIIALGGVAYKAIGRAYTSSLPPFAHAQEVDISATLTLLASFHPSRINVNTGRLQLDMLVAVLQRARQLIA